MKTLEDFVRPGTHLTHCCVLHGCKYGDDFPGGDGCPVTEEVAVQSYPCERCETPEELRAQIDGLKRELQQAEVLRAKIAAEGYDPDSDGL